MSDPRDDLAALVASRRGVTAKVNDTDRWVADAIIAAGWVKPEPPTVHPDHDIETLSGTRGRRRPKPSNEANRPRPVGLGLT
jgi:hypothetical protein